MQIRIRGLAFSLTEPFSEGHRLTLAEAQALNALRAENIRNNCAKLVHQALAASPDNLTLGAEALAECQQAIAKYDQAYRFQPRHETKQVLGTLEAELRDLAEMEAEKAFREIDQVPTMDEFEDFVAEAMKDQALVDLARRRLVIKAEVANKGLDSLL